MPRQTELACFQTVGNKTFENDLFVRLTICEIPESLLIEFAQKVVKPHYPEGISAAIKDLMQRTLEKERKKSTT
jgi:hypothetical protein